MDDELERVNDIDVSKLQPEAFHKIIDELPYEVTIEVKRGKQRWTGKFG
jgi:GTPase Era involved in 16S rRNA processing